MSCFKAELAIAGTGPPCLISSMQIRSSDKAKLTFILIIWSVGLHANFSPLGPTSLRCILVHCNITDSETTRSGKLCLRLGRSPWAYTTIGRITNASNIRDSR